ncbi:hypothetical protein [Mongoliitalea daihaiensis]|uniref:hypothetical protein n=1 Tax=Mongoliitalea daihaiensis TaxID=2782006 RepID=UPI001F3D91E8|nr:hypothetical protein [Mongoliitalea daihaiensis]UJP66077.1 hypothetical protein IPZ59_05490 [Mongoliitalea daihaiensis]
MKKLSAILLLCCFALYHFGYYVAYYSFNIQIEKNWVETIYGEQQGYLQEQMMEIPLSLPYMADEEQFRSTNTVFEKDGQLYRAIKQRYTKDTLQVIYVPDTAKSNLQSTIKQWVNSLVQDDLPDGSSNSLLSKSFVKDYQPTEIYKLTAPVQLKELISTIGFIFSTYDVQFLNIHTPPPEE